MVTASVVLYNTPEDQLKRLVDCIASSFQKLHLYLVDNSPNSVDSELFHLPAVTYIKAKANQGYGAGHNIALRKTIDFANFHFVINPDISFSPEELGKMIQFMENNPSVGQLMPKVVYPGGRTQYLCKLIPTPADLLLRRFAVGPLKAWASKKLEQFELRFTGYEREMDVPYLSGCFMLFRTSALKRIGLFDERFFMYPEDIDITRRMHTEFRTVFFPDAIVVHDHAQESYKSRRALMVHIINLIKYFNKWGWIRDKQRTKINREVIQQFKDRNTSQSQTISAQS